MRKLTLFMTTSLDGFISGTTDTENLDEPSPEEHAFANEQFASADTVLFGRITYEGFSSYWDTLDLLDASVPPEEVAFAQIFRQLKRVVFSRTLSRVDSKAVLIRGDLANDVIQLKQESGKDMLLVCGPELLVTLLDLDLVDELMILISPTVLAGGKSLYETLTRPMKLTLTGTRAFRAGTVLHHYQINHNQ